MKNLRIYLSITVLALFSLGCGTDSPVPESLQDQVFERLSGEWAFGGNGFIRVDGSDVSSNYNGFALSFDDGTYTTTNAGDLFNATGTWEWADDDSGIADQINLDDGKVVNLVEVNPNVLIFGFTKSDGPVRAGIAGEYLIRVEK